MLSIAVDVKENIEPAVAYAAPHEAFVAVWASEQDVSTHDIWARAVTSDGTLQSTFVVESNVGQRLHEPAVAYGSAQDEYLVVYIDQAWSIWARRISWNGPGATSSFAIDSSPGGHNPAVAYNSQSDEFLVVYEASGGDIKAVLVTADTGIASSPTSLASATPSKYHSRPDVAYDPVNNQFIVGYEYDEPTSRDGILIRTVAADLSGMSPEYEIAGYSNAREVTRPAISTAPSGVLVAFEYYEGLNMSIYARRAELDGTPLEPTNGFLVLSSTNNLSKGKPDVCHDGDGRHLVVWRSFDISISDGNIQGQYISATSNQTIGSRFGIDTSPGDQDEPAVACKGDGLALVALSDQPNPTPNDFDVVGYLVDSNLFADDFESGDCSEWSTVVGELP